MKTSKICILLGLLLLVLVGVGAGLFFEVGQARVFGETFDSWYAADLRTRQSEICCAHLGVNSFHIWNRDIELPGFKPMSRPDKPDVTYSGRTVHAYPAWHTCFCYFYGWLSVDTCRRMMTTAMILSLLFIAVVSYTSFKKRVEDALIPTLGVVALVSNSATHCFYWHNYGIVILLFLILMQKCLTRGYQVWAGCLWALMMIKPQIAMLFCWPLLFEKRYKTIVVAVAVCLGATCIVGWIYGESPIALICQVPQIGLPYAHVNFFEGLLVSCLGTWVQHVWMFGCFVLCGVLSYLLRGAKDWEVRFLPAVALIPFWTYTQQHDLIVFWVLYMALFYLTYGNAERRGVWFMVSALFCVVFFQSLWNAITVYGNLNCSGWGWIYRLSELMQMGLIAQLIAYWMLSCTRKFPRRCSTNSCN